MSGMFLAMRFIIAALAIAALVTLATPVNAQQDVLVNPTASSVKEDQLLREVPRIEGQITIPDRRERVLIQPEGRTWRYFHEVVLRWFGAIIILMTVVALAAAYLILGPIRLESGRSGRKVPRFSPFERFVHWTTAISFVILGLTGLNVTFGKKLLLPLMGPDGFSRFSEAAKYLHDFMAFPFMFGIALMAALWLKDNVFEPIDWEWLRQGGGFIKRRHPPARRFNAGEKLVFWLALAAGAAIAASGLLLLFPFYLTNIAGMQIAQVMHGVIAMLFIALILGHIYIGTIGMEDAFEAMWTGEVDLNWAREHHRQWLEEKPAKRNDAPEGPHLSARPIR
ncbi:MAG: formate dehydrogenase subunit gamma [Hyphomicrobiales bacterium]|jgi:formate dehydrogenase subunit gamma